MLNNNNINPGIYLSLPLCLPLLAGRDLTINALRSLFAGMPVCENFAIFA